MDPKRWKQVDELLQSALARPESDREAFLHQVCAGDDALEREVRSLLASHREAASFLQSPAVEVAARALALEHRELEKSSESLIGRTISHYRIVEKLGGGGMGVVYKAQDTDLGRFVAVKFLSDELARDPHALERFRREARTASALNHPNICTIYEIGNSAGQSFIVMEFLDGQTLRDCLAAEAEGQKALPLEELLDIGIQVSEGLETAHEKGIIHRDIKPANIFITSKGVVKILDFGLAKLLEASETEEIVAKEQNHVAQPASGRSNQVGLTLTRTGVPMGTAGYMSPEQVRGEKLDARTDIFSLGLVLYEMATGRRAFTGETVATVHDAILNNSPVPVRELNSSLPATLVTTIDKVLHKKRELRYQTADELGSALQREPAAQSQFKSSQRRGAKTKLIVLPFENLGKDTGHGYFGDGLTEEMITQIGRLNPARLGVIARSTTMRYKGIGKPIKEIGRELDVRYVLEGAVLRAGDRVRISVRLIRVADETNLWAETYERPLADVLQLQAEIARSTASEIHLSLTREQPLTPGELYRVDPEVNGDYFESRDCCNRSTEEGLAIAVGYFNHW